MAAIFAAGAGAETLLLERTRDGGRKILISGGGRCNILPSRVDETRFVTDSSPQRCGRCCAPGRCASRSRSSRATLGMPLRRGGGVGQAVPGVEQRPRRARRAAALMREHAGRDAAHETRSSPASRRMEAAGESRSRRRCRGSRGRGDRRDGRPLRAERPAATATGLRDARAARPHRCTRPTRRSRRSPLAGRHSRELAGVSLPVTLTARERASAQRRRRGGFLFTHRGYSGPSVLDVSHVAVRARQDARRQPTLRCGGRALGDAEWRAALEPQGTRTVAAALRGRCCRTVWPTRCVERAGERRRDSPLAAACVARALARSSMMLVRGELPWTGDEGYKKAEVTGGGVSLARGGPAHDGEPASTRASSSAARCSTPSGRSAATTSCGPGPRAGPPAWLPPRTCYNQGFHPMPRSRPWPSAKVILPMISVSGVSMRFGSKVLFEDVTTTFSAGRRYGLTGPERRRQVHVHEAADRRARRRRRARSSGRDKLGVLRQDQFAFDAVPRHRHRRSWATSGCGRRSQERDALYAKPDMTDDDGMRLGELEGIVGEEDGYSAESDAAILLQGLDIPDELHERTMAELQGGQKVRVLLAQALFGQPEALLLDEPTNHLDLDSIHWLQRVPRPLRRHADRHLARSPLPERGLHAHRRHRLPDDHHLHRRLRRHGAGQDADPLARSRRDNAQREKKIAQLNDFIARFCAGTRASQVHVAAQGSRAAADDRAGALEHPAPVHQVHDERGRRADGRSSARASPRRYGDLHGRRRTSTPIVNRGEKIVLVGRNGVGKTTLLKALLADAPDLPAVARRPRRRHGPLGPRGVDRLLPAGSHRRDREGHDRGRVAAPVRSRTRRARTSTACSARCCSAAKKGSSRPRRCRAARRRGCSSAASCCRSRTCSCSTSRPTTSTSNRSTR